jgi:hypothetical protein
LKSINLTKVEGLLTMRINNIHNNSHIKTLHLLVELDNNLLEGLVDIGASMAILFVVVDAPPSSLVDSLQVQR